MRTYHLHCLVALAMVMLAVCWLMLTPQLVTGNEIRGAKIGCPCRTTGGDGCQPKQGENCSEVFTKCDDEKLDGWICGYYMTGSPPAYVMQCTGSGCAAQWKKETCMSQ